MRPPAGYDGWQRVRAAPDAWVVAPPPGTPDALFVVTPTVVRRVHPAVESVPQVLAELGIDPPDGRD
jgi:hypothetical protein